MPEASTDVYLLERETEQRSLAGLLDSAAAGRGGLLAFEGPAGIGKTRLLRDATESAVARQMTVGKARGAALERDFAFGAVRQLLEPLIVTTPNSKRLFRGAATAAAPIFGRTAGDARPAEPGAVLHGLYWRVGVGVAETPVVAGHSGSAR